MGTTPLHRYTATPQHRQDVGEGVIMQASIHDAKGPLSHATASHQILPFTTTVLVQCDGARPGSPHQGSTDTMHFSTSGLRPCSGTALHDFADLETTSGPTYDGGTTSAVTCYVIWCHTAPACLHGTNRPHDKRGITTCVMTIMFSTQGSKLHQLTSRGVRGYFLEYFLATFIDHVDILLGLSVVEGKCGF